MILNLDKSAWTRVRFGDVVRNVNEYFDRTGGEVLPYVAGPHIAPTEMQVREYGASDDDQFPPTFKRLFQADDVLLHSRGIEKIAVVDRKGVTGEKLFVLRTMNDAILAQKFLPIALRSSVFERYLEKNFTGSVNRFLNWKPLATFEFNLPPLGEQKRIADLLWAIEAHRESIKKSRAALAALLASVLEQFWADGPLVAISEIGRCVTGSTPSKANPEYWDAPDVPFYTPSEIKDGEMQTARQYVSVLGAAKGRLIPRNSVAVACIGGELGKSAVVAEPGITNQQITAVTGLVADDAVALQSLLAHPRGRAAMNARETTTIVRKLNKSDLMKVEVPWPGERSSLHTAVRSHFSALGSAEAELSALDDLRSAVLAEIFGG